MSLSGQWTPSKKPVIITRIEPHHSQPRKSNVEVKSTTTKRRS
jgi:hypothetical protein